MRLCQRCLWHLCLSVIVLHPLNLGSHGTIFNHRTYQGPWRHPPLELCRSVIFLSLLWPFYSDLFCELFTMTLISCDLFTTPLTCGPKGDFWWSWGAMGKVQKKGGSSRVLIHGSHVFKFSHVGVLDLIFSLFSKKWKFHPLTEQVYWFTISED